jgi:Glycosyl transferase family 2
MGNPLVSFIVPCYKLAHYLRPCVDSILNQTYGRVEVLIMDDCSPDDTPLVAASYNDARVQHVRNEPNLGHLRNYNKGIGMASGDYIWLLSADDCLRERDVVERYVRLMEENLRLAYVFCPAMGLDGSGEETGVVEWSRPFPKDAIFEGRRFLATLAKGDCVCAPSGMVRRRCYEVAGMFPLDLPIAGDWYLWCAFALHGDVAYLAEPMVYYRMHGANMSTMLRANNRLPLVREDQTKVLWRLKTMAEKAGFLEVSEICVEGLVMQYAITLAETAPVQTSEAMVQSVETALERHARAQERAAMRTRIYSSLGNQLYGHKDLLGAAYFYRQTLRCNPALWECAVKLALLKMGRAGVVVRNALSRLRCMAAHG